MSYYQQHCHAESQHITSLHVASPVIGGVQAIVREIYGWCVWIKDLVPHVLPRLQTVRLDTGIPSVRPSSSCILAILVHYPPFPHTFPSVSKLDVSTLLPTARTHDFMCKAAWPHMREQLSG